MKFIFAYCGLVEEIPTELPKIKLLLPFQRQPSLGQIDCPSKWRAAKQSKPSALTFVRGSLRVQVVIGTEAARQAIRLLTRIKNGQYSKERSHDPMFKESSRLQVIIIKFLVAPSHPVPSPSSFLVFSGSFRIQPTKSESLFGKRAAKYHSSPPDEAQSTTPRYHDHQRWFHAAGGLREAEVGTRRHV